MNYEKTLLFAAGFVVGVGAVCFVRSAAGKKTAVAIAAKGMKLKECGAGTAERVKESFEDIVAEAKYVNEQTAETN